MKKPPVQNQFRLGVIAAAATLSQQKTFVAAASLSQQKTFVAAASLSQQKTFVAAASLSQQKTFAAAASLSLPKHLPLPLRFRYQNICCCRFTFAQKRSTE
ncbi:hypothetical protein [Lysinibacillus xylanilyticus]|uniref:hypothetical protein n=1 Tax=Lysinibacillus xylanilyticus TaxID=582475 RepID=UPI0013791489|nr:hypothetical protein [Lysinibacillus xylanilyticus]